MKKGWVLYIRYSTRFSFLSAGPEDKFLQGKGYSFVPVSPVFQFIGVGRRESFRKTLRKRRKGCLCAISVKPETFSLKSSFKLSLFIHIIHLFSSAHCWIWQSTEQNFLSFSTWIDLCVLRKRFYEGKYWSSYQPLKKQGSYQLLWCWL